MIKRILSLAAVLLLLVSCSSDDSGTNSGGGGSGSISTDYYPLAAGNVWYFTQYRDGVAYQSRIRILSEAALPDGTIVFEKGSKLRYVRKTAHALLFSYDLADNNADCSWPWPFAVGNQVVDCHFDSGGEIRNGVFAAKEAITVPAGTFECYRLDWPDFTQWFAPGVGLVQYREPIGGGWVREDRLDSCSLK